VSSESGLLHGGMVGRATLPKLRCAALGLFASIGGRLAICVANRVEGIGNNQTWSHIVFASNSHLCYKFTDVIFYFAFSLEFQHKIIFGQADILLRVEIEIEIVLPSRNFSST
jgi:hypothetical protein